MLRHAGTSVGGLLVALLGFAGCGSSKQSSVEQDAALAVGDVAVVVEAALAVDDSVDQTSSTDLVTATDTVPSLETGVDQTALLAAVRPQVIEYIRATLPAVDADTIRLGRPWGDFNVHKGPRLEFLGSWWMGVSLGGDYFEAVSAAREGDSYLMTSIGSAGLAQIMAEREKMPAVSAALDQGRAAFLRCVGDGGPSLAAYEAESIVDAGATKIMVQPIFVDRRFGGIDAGPAGITEMSLAAFDPMLPAE